MSEELKGQMERRTAQQGVAVPASPSTRSSSVSVKETGKSFNREIFVFIINITVFSVVLNIFNLLKDKTHLLMFVP